MSYAPRILEGTLLPASLVLAGLALAACGGGADAPPWEGPLPAPGARQAKARHVVVEAETAERPRGTYVVRTFPDDVRRAWSDEFRGLPAPVKRTIFVNRKGGTYKPGNDDSSTNTSSIPGFTATIPPYEKGDAAWAKFLACIQDEYKRWNVEVTDVDPGAAAHVEAVIGGNPYDAGMGGGVGGVAPVDDQCGVVERAVVYIFSKQYSDPEDECETAAQEIGHAFGMDHELLASDPMTYLGYNGHRVFQDQAAKCGEYSPRTCMCGGSTQNSVKWLDQTLGVKPTGPDTTKPQAAITFPDDGAKLPQDTDLTVTATATDDVALGKVELVWELFGTTVSMDCGAVPQKVACTPSGSSFAWKFPVGNGPRTLSVRATDKANNVFVSPKRSILLGKFQPPTPPSGNPTVSVDKPAQGSSVQPGADISVAVTAKDNGKVVSVSLLWKSPAGQASYDLDPLGGDQWGLDVTVSSNAKAGPRTLQVTAVDNDGNKTVAPDRVINVGP